MKRVRTWLNHNFFLVWTKAFVLRFWSIHTREYFHACVLSHVQHFVVMSILLQSKYEINSTVYIQNVILTLCSSVCCGLPLVRCLFQSWPNTAHPLRFSWFFSAPRDKYWDVTTVTLRPLLSNPFQFIIHQSYYHRPYTVWHAVALQNK